MPQHNQAMMQTFLKEGFDVIEATDLPPRRLLVGSQGQERTGKTDWALRDTPGPLIYIGLDFGHEGVIEKFADTKLIATKIVNVPVVADQNMYLKHWNDLYDAIHKAIHHPNVRTVVLDTGTDVWELLRLAEFGALTKSGDVKQLYNIINQRYRSVIKMAYDRSINMIVIHKVKKRYVSKTVQTNRGQQTSEVWEGAYERAGFGESGYLVQVQIEHMFDINHGKTTEDHFGIRVIDCRQNMDIVGQELWGRDNTFKTLAQYVFPESDSKEWE